MKKCTYCGREAPDEATTCAIDGEPVVDPAAPEVAPTEFKPVVTATPLFGTLSVGLPVLMFLILLLSMLGVGGAGLALMWGFVLLPASSICGLIFVFVAVLRRERYRVLVWIGLPINLAALILALSGLNSSWHM